MTNTVLDQNTKESRWDQIFEKVLTIPGVRVDRQAYLRSLLSKYYSEEQIVKAIQTRPALAGIPSTAIDSFARGSIAWHRTGVSVVSAGLSAPGGMTLPITITSDLAQFFYHVVVVAQKLAYLYGWPDFFEEGGKLDDGTAHILTVFVGVMMGMEGASRGLSELAKALATQVAVRVQQMALTKTLVFQLSKETSKWLGLRLTKDIFARSLSRLVPVVSSVIGGTMTWVAFSTMARTLRLHLRGMELAKP